MKVLILLSMLVAAAFAASYGAPVPLHQSDAVPLQASSSGGSLATNCMNSYQCLAACIGSCSAAITARCVDNQCYCGV